MLKSQQIDELTLLNLSIDSTYDLRTCFRVEQIDTLEQLMIVEDTARTFAFDTKDQKKYILKTLGKNSKFYSFVREFHKPIPSRRYSIDSLHQGKIRFLTKTTFENENRKYRFGKYERQMFLGYFRFSRVYIDGKRGLAMFIMSWLGGGLCGYNNLILLSFQNGVWKYEQKIMLGVY